MGQGTGHKSRAPVSADESCHDQLHPAHLTGGRWAGRGKGRCGGGGGAQRGPRRLKCPAGRWPRLWEDRHSECPAVTGPRNQAPRPGPGQPAPCTRPRRGVRLPCGPPEPSALAPTPSPTSPSPAKDPRPCKIPKCFCDTTARAGSAAPILPDQPLGPADGSGGGSGEQSPIRGQAQHLGRPGPGGPVLGRCCTKDGPAPSQARPGRVGLLSVGTAVSQQRPRGEAVRWVEVDPGQ